MDKPTFLATYNLTECDLQEANISWEELSMIAEEYGKLEHSLREIGKSFIDEIGRASCRERVSGHV